MMIKIFAAILITFSLTLSEAQQFGGKGKGNMKKSIAFMKRMDRQMNKLATASAYASWNWSVNLTDHNLKIKERATQKSTEFVKKLQLTARKYPWKNFKGKNSTIFRWFQLVVKGLTSMNSDVCYEKETDEDGSPFSKMTKIFTKAKETKDYSKIIETSRNTEELKEAWLSFREKTGEKYKDLFLESIKIENESAKKFGFKNQAVANIQQYEDEDFVNNMAKQMKKILPFYKQIHAYVRKKLKKHYKNIKSKGPIPAHLLGNMYAQKWFDIFDLVKPFPKSSGLPNVTKALKEKKMEAIDLFIMAEKFFESIGMPPMTPHFWHYSMIKKPVGRVADCHASAHNFNNQKDYRIKMCTSVTSSDLEVIHHEMGHIEYYMLYNNLPYLFRDSANPGFHEAIGDAISLSVLTTSYLQKVGLLKKDEVKKNREFTINYLMNMALRYAVSIPYAYIIDHWRNKVYEGKIKSSELNRKYWEYRLKYQGVCPPSKRTEKNFDIGAKWHIAGGVEYFRYCVANILQFQIHKVLCKEAGHKGPLHECNIYKNKKAGSAFKKLLSQGRSKNWKQLLHSFSGGTFKKLDVSAMLEYFKPLIGWLKKNNKKEYIGWKSDDPMSCPGDEESTDDEDTTKSTDDTDAVEEKFTSRALKTTTKSGTKSEEESVEDTDEDAYEYTDEDADGDTDEDDDGSADEDTDESTDEDDDGGTDEDTDESTDEDDDGGTDEDTDEDGHDKDDDEGTDDDDDGDSDEDTDEDSDEGTDEDAKEFTRRVREKPTKKFTEYGEEAAEYTDEDIADDERIVRTIPTKSATALPTERIL